MTVGQNIKKYRKDAGISQIKLAELTGLSIGTIQGYEQERYLPKYENLKKLADVLECKVSDLDPNYADKLFKDMSNSVANAIFNHRLQTAAEKYDKDNPPLFPEEDFRLDIILGKAQQLNDIARDKIIAYENDLIMSGKYKK